MITMHLITHNSQVKMYLELNPKHSHAFFNKTETDKPVIFFQEDEYLLFQHACPHCMPQRL